LGTGKESTMVHSRGWGGRYGKSEREGGDVRGREGVDGRRCEILNVTYI
jgi:hypothetical protein